MSFSLPQVISSKFCLDCRGCCRFKEPHSPWRPKVYASEEKLFAHEDFDKNLLDSQGRVATRACGEEHSCLFLDSLTNECQVYKARPFECALYPFVLLERSDGLFLAAHLACPFVQSVGSFDTYLEDLKRFFEQKDIQSFLKAHRREITSSHIYDDEVQILTCVLPL